MTGDKALGLMLRWLLRCERDDQRLVDSARLPDRAGPLEELLASGRDSDTRHPRVTNSAAADGPTFDGPNAGIKQSALDQFFRSGSRLLGSQAGTPSPRGRFVALVARRFPCTIAGLVYCFWSDPRRASLWEIEVKKLLNWSIATVATTLAIVISAEFLDRPIARLCYRVFGHLMVARQFAGTPSFFGPLEIVVLSVFLFRRIVLYPLTYADAVIALCETSLIMTKLLLAPSKFVFGRTWPLYADPSYLIDGSYGFNFFRSGPAFEAFPSGHTAAVCALAAVLWMTYPRFRLLYAAGATTVAIALIAGDFHFLSDVLGGGFLGVSVALLILVALGFEEKRFREPLRIEIFGAII